MARSCSFPAAARIRRRREFLDLQRTGNRRHTPHLVVITREAAGARSRLGVTASKRVGNAVARNRLKRLVREVFRQLPRERPPATDIVVIAKPGAQTLTYAQAAAEFRSALRAYRQR